MCLRLLLGTSTRCSSVLLSARPRSCSSLLQHHAVFRPISTDISSYTSSSNIVEEWTGYGVSIEQAVTLPASWYTNPLSLQLEKRHVFYNTWQMVCDVGQLQQPGDFICGTLGDVRYLVVHGQDGQLRAFHNVCRHHAAAVAKGCGNQLLFQCPYHNWTYDDRGRLVKATRLKGIKDFKATQYGLHPIALDTWGHFVFIHLQGGRPSPPAAAGTTAAGSTGTAAGTGTTRARAGTGVAALPGVADWLGAGGQRLHEVGMCDGQLLHVARREYVINCNWKVFCDNYLDGGYHVPYAHKDLAAGLDLSGYSNELHELLSIQGCGVKGASASSSSSSSGGSSSSSGSGSSDEEEGSGAAGAGDGGDAPLDRLAGGRDAAYAFVYPNLMINRYGPWMDTNIVVPFSGSSTDRCRVIFDYWLEQGAVQRAAAMADGHGDANPSSSSSSSSGGPNAGSKRTACSAAVIEAARTSAFVVDSLASSHQVQEEDIALCEAVQLGLQEPAYGVGRYAPGPEAPMYHFHTLLYSKIMEGMKKEQQ